MPSAKTILCGLVVLIAIVAYVNCSINEEGLKLLKRGIILKCQGNPVSCYGKRTQKAKKNIDEPTSLIENEYEMEHAKEVKYEREIENLIESCRYGSDKSCSQILKIMLMNANMNE